LEELVKLLLLEKKKVLNYKGDPHREIVLVRSFIQVGGTDNHTRKPWGKLEFIGKHERFVGGQEFDMMELTSARTYKMNRRLETSRGTSRLNRGEKNPGGRQRGGG